MGNHYVPAAEALRKLELAYAMKASVYIYGATGFGKTRLANEYLKDSNPICFSAYDEWDLSLIREPEEGVIQHVIIDDLHQLNDDYRKEVILELEKRQDIWMILIGRMQTPSYLIPLIADGRLVVISEENLSLTVKEMERLLELSGLEMSEEEVSNTVQMSRGNASMIASLIQGAITTDYSLDDLRKQISRYFIEHLEKNVIPQWSTSLQEFLMQVSVVDEFDLPTAVMITGDDQAANMLEAASHVGNFMTYSDGVYRIRPILVVALRRSALKVLGLQKYNQCCQNAGLYYETHGNTLKALELYEKSGNTSNIRSLLIRNGQRHMGEGCFYDLRKYYLSLKEEDVVSSPTLMFVLSLLYSVQMNPESSEYWYTKLKDHASNAKGDDKREANGFLLYLDVALPHRGNIDMVDVVRRGISLITTGGIRLPEFNVTNNSPSTMNGGKDFCSWSKHDKLMAETIGKVLERFLGRFGRGLVNAGVGESLYEKGMDDDDALHHIMLAQMEVEGGGKIEILFACIGIQIRMNLLQGNTRNAIQMLDAFEKRVLDENAVQLLPHLAALRCRVMLMKGDREAVAAWMKDAPDEMSDFWVLDRYLYMTKVLCYIQSGDDSKAMGLLGKLRYYSEMNKRPYYHMETGLLMAIVNRNESKDWKALFLETLKEIEEYGFIRIISEKGAGVLPLLKEIRKDYLALSDANQKWFNSVLKETGSVAESYPGYLVCESAQRSDFNETSISILKMQAQGYCIKEIAQALKISERTVKYHCAENYRKLEAKGKTDAVQIARKLNLI